jgi:hypothetical protein
MMQDNTPINFYIKHFFINCQIKKLQPIFDTFVPPCIIYQRTDIVTGESPRRRGGVPRGRSAKGAKRQVGEAPRGRSTNGGEAPRDDGILSGPPSV